MISLVEALNLGASTKILMFFNNWPIDHFEL